MKIILSDKPLTGCAFAEDVQVKRTSLKALSAFDGSQEVVAIAGSRAMAQKAVVMDLPGLKLYQLTSAGFDGVPCEAFREKGVDVANAGSVYSAPIAETVVFGLLYMAKRLHPNPNNRRLKLQRHYAQITELAGKKILIMGAGNIGTAIASRLQGFEAQIDGYDPFCPEKPEYGKMIRSREQLKQGLREYDYIISTLPANRETEDFINSELFDCMKNTAVIVNVGRKAVFNEKDFYQALKSKRIGGAVLDMFEKLPNPITNPFRRLSNVVVLPGVSAISQEVNARLKAHMYRNLQACLNGDAIQNVINKKV
ncbi:MAG: hypothetical protein IJZ15_07780 [Oscillospiraceae bacterium]|nr:hypothetical protein [Oscillospiraceae bacterium]MBQ8769520.1 hypothetical protein [Oscillospiraceae bacterium]